MHDSASRVVDRLSRSDSHEFVDAVVSASRALVGVAARSLVGLEEEVTLAQYRMLVLLCSRGPQRVADLAQALGVNASTAVRMSDRLVAKRLARRQRMVSDRRSVRVGAMPMGRSLVGEVTERRRREIARIVDAMAPESREVFVEALRAFAAAAGEVPEQSWSAGWE
jgi:DNA-binding MarR family transcriptional regulator